MATKTKETETLEERCKRVILGWKWMSFLGSVRNARCERVPSRIRVLLPESAFSPSGSWRDVRLSPADMTEPTHEEMPGYFDVVLEVEKELRKQKLWDAYLAAIPTVKWNAREKERPHVPSDRVLLESALLVVGNR